MKAINFPEFDTIYQNNVQFILQYWTKEMQEEIASNCYSWHPNKYDFKIYLEKSSIRFYTAYCLFVQYENIKSICDIGGFFGVFALTLKTLGYEVTMTECLKYYSNAFDIRIL